MIERKRTDVIKQGLVQHLVILCGTLAFLWLIEILNAFVFRGGLDQYGIQPRTWAGFSHIFFAPFIHESFAHLLANTLPFLVLGWFVMLRRTNDFFVAGTVAALISGLGIWLFGAPHTTHIGVSGVVFGFLGFLVARGYFERSLSSLLLALFAVLLYGGMLWGVLPGQAGISWLGHLFGFAGGGLAAYLIVDQAA